jgi:hypothetical protein
VNQNHLILNSGKINIDRCTLLMCSADIGGAISSDGSNVQIRFTTFKLNHARIAGACYHIRSKSVTYYGNSFFLNRADYDGAGMYDVDETVKTSALNATNFSLNSARLWSGGWRVDAVGGVLSHCVFDSNSASVNGAFFDFSWKPAHREVSHCLFANNSAQARGGAVCAFHLQHSSHFEKVVFFANRCAQGPRSISVESIDTTIWLTDVYFDGKEGEELGMRFGESEFVNLGRVQFEVAQAEIVQRANLIRAKQQSAQQQG